MSFLVAGLLLMASSPSGQSQIDWRWERDALCGLRQDLDGRKAFVIGRTPGNDQTTVTLHNSDVQASSWKPFTAATIVLEPGGKTDVDGSIGPGVQPGSRIIIMHFIDQGFLDQFSRVSGLTLSHDEFGSIYIPVRSSAAAVQALRTCEDRTMREWGIDPIAWRALKSRPTPATPATTWFSSDDYPRIAAIYNMGGFVVAKLDVGADGTVRKCKTVNQPIPDFRDAACEALKRNARFHPALDADGQPVSAPYVLRVRFQPNR